MQLPLLPAYVRDALDSVLIAGPPKTGIRRLYLLDLLVGYGLRSEMSRGWWCRRALRLHTCRRTHEYYAEQRGYRLGPTDSPAEWRDPAYRRAWQVHPAVDSGEWHSEWKAPWRSKLRARAVQVAWRAMRERLHEETGHRAIWTADEAADAARVYASSPKGIAYRALMTLVDNPLIWSRSHAA